VEAEDEMPKFKIQMTNDGVRNTRHGHGSRARNIMSNVNGLLPISLERTLKNFWESFLVKRNGYKSRV